MITSREERREIDSKSPPPPPPPLGSILLLYSISRWIDGVLVLLCFVSGSLRLFSLSAFPFLFALDPPHTKTLGMFAFIPSLSLSVSYSPSTYYSVSYPPSTYYSVSHPPSTYNSFLSLRLLSTLCLSFLSSLHHIIEYHYLWPKCWGPKVPLIPNY